MPPPGQPNLFCMPSDVMDYIGADALQMRLDDHLQATGQRITVTAPGAVGTTALAVTPLLFPLLNGSTLEFDGGGQGAVVEVVLTAVANVGATSLSVAALPAAISQGAAANDNGVNTALAARASKACQYGTAICKDYCCGKYDENQLVTSWSMNLRATIIASRWLAKRLFRPCPAGIQDDYEEVMEQLQRINTGQLRLGDVGTRTASFPFVTNVTVDLFYDYAKIRVEQPLSEGTPTQYGQRIDWNSLFLFEI